MTRFLTFSIPRPIQRKPRCTRGFAAGWVMLLCCTFSAGSAWAAIDAYPFPDDEMSARYDRLIAELRCPQCLNTNLAGSDAMIARDLRREVHRMLLEGKSDEEILTHLHDRYGDFILYRPRLSQGTLLLWFGPALLLLTAALVLAFMLVRMRRQERQPSLDGDEQARLQRLLSDAGTPSEAGSLPARGEKDD